MLNMRGAYKFWKQQASAGSLREAKVAISVFNALNDKASESPNGEKIGRRFMGWLTVRFLMDSSNYPNAGCRFWMDVLQIM